MSLYDVVLDFASNLIGDALSEGAAIVAGIYHAILSLAYIILYPFAKILGGILDIFYSVTSPIHGLANNFYGLYYDLTNLINNLSSLLPSQWIALLLVLLTIVVGLRIYAYVSDVSIFGWKI